MNSSTRRAACVNRTIRLERVPTEHRTGKVIITADGKATAYLITRLESQLGGIAFRLDKIATEYEPEEEGVLTMRIAERYNVLLDGQQSSCSCRWGIYGAHRKPCRHVAGLLQLHADGKLLERSEPNA